MNWWEDILKPFFWYFMLVVATIVYLFCCSACVSLGPSDWRWDEHFMTMKACRVSCYPNGMKSYEAMDGHCTCQLRKESRK